MAGVVDCSKLDITNISEDSIVVIGDKAWIKAQVEEKIFYYFQRPCAVIKFDDACYARICSDLDPVPKALLGVVDNLGLIDKCGAPAGNQGGGGDGGDGGPCDKPCDQVPPDCPNYPKNPGDCVDGENVEGNPKGVDPKRGASDRKARTVREIDEEGKKKLNKAKSAVDIRAINRLGFQGTAVTPSVAIVPLASNLHTYGPYISSNFGTSCGGTQVQSNSELAPWVFGSVAGMNTAGWSLVENAAIGLTKAETGSITIPGMPISQFTELGNALGSGGATLSSMNFNFGSSGVSTTYEFRTYTPKFGSLNRHLIDRIKDASKYRTEQLRFLRNNQITLNKIGRKINRFNRRFPPPAAGTLQRVLVAEIFDWQKDGQNSIVGIDYLRGSVGEMVYDYDKKAYMSLDGLFGPISKKGDGSLPRYANFEVGCHKASPEEPQPPFAIKKDPPSEGEDIGPLDQYNLEITQKYFDPLTNKFVDKAHHHDGEGRGHVVDIVGRNKEVPEKSVITNFYHLDDANRYSEDYRFLGMRGPLLLHSWGYDTQGKPIPNETDTVDNSKVGTFAKENLKDAFLKDWLAKPATWPVAPIDFRFDRKRGVWVSPPGYRVVVAELTSRLDPYGTATAQLINKDKEHDKEFGPVLYDKDGKEVKATEEDDSKAIITIVDRIGASYPDGTKVYCYYDSFKCEYIVLESKPNQAVRFKLIDLCDYAPVQADYGDDWTKYAGYGDKFPNNHITAVRIDCEGNPVDKTGKKINHEDIADLEKRKDILINLYDTCGQHGPAFAYYSLNNGQESFNIWKDKAATGFGLICTPSPSGYCTLGESTTQCGAINEDYPSYEIVFLDTYARFVECKLTQKLYVDSATAEKEYSNDTYKKLNPEGNAAAYLENYYGHSPNGLQPEFFSVEGDGLKEVDFRVFDPFKDFPADKNPFRKLDKDDKVLAVFDEKRKKYVIYNALRRDDKVIKFALVDNKDIDDRDSRAVLVDYEGYPIDEGGTRLTEDNFNKNFIVVHDAFAVHGTSKPQPLYHNFGTTGFGPALGSEDFKEHMKGIPLLGSGDQLPPPKLSDNTTPSTWTGGPFIGYALRRTTKKIKDDESKAVEEDIKNEIFFLERFAEIVIGKVASTYKVIDGKYYLGVLNLGTGKEGFINGRVPFTRQTIAEEPKFNLRLGYPLDQHAAGKYITGSWYDENWRIAGNAFKSVDGCNCIAKLDHVQSKVNANPGEEKLYYTIIEVENVANRGKTVLTKKEKSDELNASETKESQDPSSGILSEYLDGFMWNKEKTKSKYEKTTIQNREDWKGRALITKYKNEDIKHIRTSLAAYDQADGAITYKVDYAATIAQMAEGKVAVSNPGQFGQPGLLPKADKLITKFNDSKFYHGISPNGPDLDLQDNDKPIFEVSHNWMTYEGSPLAATWDEISNGAKIEDGQYRVIYAREAPVILTGVATSTFKPSQKDNIAVQLNADNGYSSCPGFDKNPVTVLITKASNPMGYGAQKDDLVTLQRVFLQNANQDNANYKYIVIGTGKPPETC